MKIIKFGKPGCAPCDNVETFLKNKEVDFLSINPYNTDSDYDMDLIIKANVKTIPVTILLDDDGNIIKRKAGFNEKALEDLINSLV